MADIFQENVERLEHSWFGRFMPKWMRELYARARYAKAGFFCIIFGLIIALLGFPLFLVMGTDAVIVIFVGLLIILFGVLVIFFSIFSCGSFSKLMG